MCVDHEVPVELVLSTHLYMVLGIKVESSSLNREPFFPLRHLTGPVIVSETQILQNLKSDLQDSISLLITPNHQLGLKDGHRVAISSIILR